MDSEVPMDFSSFGKDDEEPQLDAVSASVSAVESPSVQLPNVPPVVITPHPPPELGAESTVVSAPVAEPSYSTSSEPPATQQPATALSPAVARPATLSVEALVSADGATGDGVGISEQPGPVALSAGSVGGGDKPAAGPAPARAAVPAAADGPQQTEAVVMVTTGPVTQAAAEPVPAVTAGPATEAVSEHAVGAGLSAPAAGAGPSAPVVSAGLSAPAAGAGPSAPVAGAGLSAPVTGAGPSAPAASAGPSAPVAGAGPSAPVAGAGPSAPVAGAGPSAPVAGAGPSAPAAGAGPSAPAAGAGPSAPAAGAGPSAPAAGVGPSAPAAGADPSAPVATVSATPAGKVVSTAAGRGPVDRPLGEAEAATNASASASASTSAGGSSALAERQEQGRLEQTVASTGVLPPVIGLEPQPAEVRQGIKQERGRQESAELPSPLQQAREAEAEATPSDAHCLVCNDLVEGDGNTGKGLQLAEYLENAHIRIEDKLGSIINNDYRLYLHSEVVCDRCHITLCQIHDLEMQTKHMKDQVVGFFWDTVEVRRVRPQRKGRRKSRPSKLLLESQETAMFMPEVDIHEDPTDVIYKAPPKKIGRYSKPKCYEKVSNNEYQCIRCHKMLPRMRAVVKHFDLVHGPKEEQCDICEKYFRDLPYLLRHKKKMHPEMLDDVPPSLEAEAAAATAAPVGDPAAPAGDVSAAAAGAAASDDATVKQEAVDESLELPPPDDDDEDDDDHDDEDYIADRAPVIDDDDGDEEGEMDEIDMDVVMNVEVERPSQPSRRGRKRRHSSRSSSMGNELGVMYTESVDESSPRFKCMLCPNSYSRAAKARDHFIAKHAQIKRFRCTLCPDMFLTYKQKRHHELSHTAEVCNKCGKKYPGNKRGMLERHVAQCGELKKCRICGAEFDNITDFIKHRRDAHEKSAACDVCGKIVSARNLASHRAIHSDERNYTCHLCGSSFKAKGSLDTHLRTHSEDRPFSCATCGRSFKHRNNWKDHERGHLNIRDFVCHFCSKSFKQAKNLKQHLRQHDANPEIFTCAHCPSTFRYKYNMLAHVKTLHTGEASRRVRRRMRAPSELSASGSGHPVLVGLDPLQLSPGSVTSDSNSGVHVVAAGAAAAGAGAGAAQHPPGSRSLPQLNPLNPGVVFMQTLQHHSIFSS